MGFDRRIEWIDMARGIGILLVIAGHTFSLSWCYPIYAFHIPLFFFLTGLASSFGRERGFMSFLRDKACTLLVPWILLLCISMVVVMFVPEWRSLLTVKNMCRDLYTSNTNFAQNSSLWYLMGAFWTVVFLRIMFFDFRLKRLTMIVALVCVAIIALLLPLILDYSPLPAKRLPFKIDSALLGVVFAGGGFILKDWIKTTWDRKHLWLFVMLFLCALFLSAFNGFTNVNGLIFGRSPIVYYPIAFCCIWGVIAFCRILEKSQTACRFLSFYGKNSLIIFGFQSLFIRAYLQIVMKMTGAELVLYGDNYWLHQVMSFVIVSFVLSPMLVFVWLRVKGVFHI